MVVVQRYIDSVPPLLRVSVNIKHHPGLPGAIARRYWRMPGFAALIDIVWAACFEEVVPDVVEPTGPKGLSPDTHAMRYTDMNSSPGIFSMASDADSDDIHAV